MNNERRKTWDMKMLIQILATLISVGLGIGGIAVRYENRITQVEDGVKQEQTGYTTMIGSLTSRLDKDDDRFDRMESKIDRLLERTHR